MNLTMNHAPRHPTRNAWTSRCRAVALWLATAGVMFGGEAHALRLTGTLADSDFPPPGPYRLEVLETGDTTSIVPGLSFPVTLPRDTLWTLCLRKEAGTGIYEKCFEVTYRPGRDTAFSVRIGNLADGAGKDTAAAGIANGGVTESGISATEGIVVAEPGMGLHAATETPEAGTGEVIEEIPVASGEDAVRLQKVVVRAQRTPKRAMGRETVSAKLIKRLPGLGEADVIRSIQGLPGVVASSDFSTKIYVRGGGSDQNLILFDNAPVFSPTHFFGLFSTFLVEGVDDVTFYKSGFPPEYGNRLSSVLDVKSRRGGKDSLNAERRLERERQREEGEEPSPDSLASWVTGSSLKISTFAAQAHTEGRQGRVRWLAAGRSTYIKQVIDYLRARGVTDLELDYYFYDMQGSLAMDLGPGRELMLSLYQGRDKLAFDPFAIEWGNTVVPVNLKWRLTDEWDSRTTLSYSLLSQGFGLEAVFGLYNNIITWRAQQAYDYTGADDHRFTLGAALERTDITFRDEQANNVQREQSAFWLTSLFAQDRWTPGNGPWEITPGARLNYMSTLNAMQVEPRLSVKRSLPLGQTVDFHVGRYVQYINSIIFSDQENLNEFYFPAKKTSFRTVNPSTSWLAALGYSRDGIFDAFSFSLEGYYKILDHLLISAAFSELPDSLINDERFEFGDSFKEAEGYSYGYEVSLRKPAGRLQAGVSYASGVAVIREDNYDQAYYPKWHQPHSLKIDGTINWTGQDGIWGRARTGKKAGRYFRSSTQIKYSTGLPYTEISGYQPSHLLDQNTGLGGGGPSPTFSDNVQTLNGNYNQAFVPSYFRWDLKPVDWGREGKWNFSWTFLNITNNPNVFFYSYDRSENPPKRITVTQFPFFPVLLSYEYYF